MAADSEVAGGYRGIWYTLGWKFEYGDKYSGGLGTYTANHVPMAVYAPEVDKTFFTYGGAPDKDRRELEIMVGDYDHAKNEAGRPVRVHADPGVDDPHDNASLQIDPSGHIWVFKSGRGTKRPGVIYRSARPFDISRFEKVTENEMAYPQPWWIKDAGFFYLFTKYTAGRELYWKTSPDGRAWSGDHKLAGFGGHYQVSGEHHGKVATFFNYHPGGDVDKRTNLYYAQTTDRGKTWTTADGRVLELPLQTVDNPALVRNLEAEGRTMYTCDLNFDRKGNPVLLYIAAGKGEPGPKGDPREWTVAHWTGSEWTHRVITKSSHNYDMGSIYVNGPEWHVIGPTEKGPQDWGAGGEMALWISSDEGKTWRKERQFTRHSKFNHSYARRPLRAKEPFLAFWADGDADALSASHLYFSDGARVWQLPYTMKKESAAPKEIR